MPKKRDNIKIIVSGLDYAGKTSILTALDKKYDFRKEILELKPTIKVEYHQFNFLGNIVNMWDMGGQKMYRELYEKKKDVYFANTDLLVYIIDVQDENRYEESLDYFSIILNYFVENEIEVPIIVSFHKFDPEIRGDENINNNISTLREKILEKFPSFKILFQITSIYDIISIVQLISYGLSVFDNEFFNLSNLFEKYLEILGCTALILFDKNGIIISEFYKDEIDPSIYVELLESIKEHLFLLKRMLEEKYEFDYNFFTLESKLLSYMHKIQYKKYPYYISVIIEETKKELLLDKFPDFIDEVTSIFKKLL
ncbi:MAG TPA: ADP-ribosylation factor-like protein [Candidatus Lokiarchaeia archaeon]